MRNLFIVSLAAAIAAHSASTDAALTKAVDLSSVERAVLDQGNRIESQIIYAKSFATTRTKRRFQASSDGRKKKKKKVKCYPPWETKACPLKPFN